jgi:hypothetical protein
MIPILSSQSIGASFGSNLLPLFVFFPILMLILCPQNLTPCSLSNRLIKQYIYISGWWFQPLWKILVRLDHHPNWGNKTTNQIIHVNQFKYISDNVFPFLAGKSLDSTVKKTLGMIQPQILMVFTPSLWMLNNFKPSIYNFYTYSNPQKG